MLGGLWEAFCVTQSPTILKFHKNVENLVKEILALDMKVKHVKFYMRSLAANILDHFSEIQTYLQILIKDCDNALQTTAFLS